MAIRVLTRLFTHSCYSFNSNPPLDNKIELLEVLRSHFMEKDKMQRNLRWPNIGKYTKSSGAVVLVVYDLHGVVDYDVEVYQG
jgi:hypothetical protein